MDPRISFVHLCAALLIGSSSALNAAAQAAFTAALDRNTIYHGERAVLSLSFQNRAPDSVPSVPSQPQLRVNYIGDETRVVISNQGQQHTRIFNYSLIPAAPGDYTIPSIQVLVDGKAVASQPLRLRVLPPDSNAADRNAAPRPAFLRLVVPKKEVYLGESLQAELQLYIQNAQDIQMPQLKVDGFTTGPLARIGSTQAQVGQSLYQVYVFRTLVTAAKTGSLTLGPAECELVLRIRNRTNSRDPLLSEFFGGGYELRPVRLFSETESINVLPLPEENRPADFNGAVGQFTLEVSASPTNVMAGDPITLTVQIAGRGGLDAITLPEQDWPNFKRYQPTSKFEPAGNDGVSGVKTFEQAVAPLNADVKQLPPVRFSFFNPDKQAYQTLEYGPIPIQVSPNPSRTAFPAFTEIPETVEVPPEPELVHIKPQFGTVTHARPPLVTQPWFLGLQALPLAACIAAFFWRKRQEHIAGNPRLRRGRRVARLTNHGLDELRRFASANEAEPFFATVFRLLQENLGHKLDLPASAITESVLNDNLRSQGASEELLGSLHHLFQLCNQARYAPQHSSQELMSIVPQVQSTIEQLANASSSQPRLQRTIALICFLGASTITDVHAGSLDPKATFDLANQLYERGEYTNAAAGYQKLIESGNTSVPVYFNLGNSMFKSGQIGQAILSYRRAEQLDPRDPAVQENLRFVRATVSGPSVQSDTWKRWVHILTLNEIAVLFTISYWTFSGLLITAILRSHPQRPRFLTSTAVVAVFLGLWLAAAFYARESAGHAVVTAPEAVVRYGPVDESQSHFTLSDGNEVKVLDEKDGWFQIKDSRGRTGWLRSNRIARI